MNPQRLSDRQVQYQRKLREARESVERLLLTEKVEALRAAKQGPKKP